VNLQQLKDNADISSMVGIHIVPAEPESQGSAERRAAESD